MKIKDRAYGIEIEYGYLLVREGNVIPINESPHDSMARQLFYRADRLLNIYVVGSLWNRNGSRTYIDTGGHPEHSTAETRSIKDALAYTFAGDRIMNNLFAHECENVSMLLFRNNIAHDAQTNQQVTYGCHENYLGNFRNPSLQTTEMVYNNLSFKPFLMTRQILDGTGYWDQAGTFFLSQRTVGCNAGIKGGGPGADIYVRVKDSSTMPRIHITWGDSTMLDVATFLKLGTTSLVLALLEADRLPMIECKDVVRQMMTVSQSNPRDRVIHTLHHALPRISACEMQRLYWKAAREYAAQAAFDSEMSAAEAEMILLLWDQALNAMETNDIRWMLGRIDWATKQWIAEHEIMRLRKGGSPLNDYEVRNDINVLYHAICGSTMRDSIYAQWPECRILHEEEIMNAIMNPPHNTRAKARGMLIGMVIKSHKQDYVTMMEDWHGITFETRERFFQFLMPDPLIIYEGNAVAWGQKVLGGGSIS